MGKIIGIDLGTTNSLAAVWQDGESTLIPNSFGEYLTPSVVSIGEDDVVYVGKIAKERLVTYPERTVSIFKRFMGTEKIYQIDDKKYRPEELSALVLRKLKEDAERYLGEDVNEAVISVPAYFNDMARKATKDAGLLAGLKVERIINEPSAAALSCHSHNMNEDETLLVFDFGGGTLDVSLVDCFDNVIEITSVSGDNHLGGSDFDQMIAEQFCKEKDLTFSTLSLKRREILLESASRAKCILTKQANTVMTVTDGEYCEKMDLDNKKLIRISMPLFERLLVPVKKVLKDGKIEMQEISKIVLVGGSCKMPTVQQYLRHHMGDCHVTTMNPDYMIALGVGVYAGIKERDQDVKDILLTDICPFTLGTSVYNPANPEKQIMRPIIERNSVLPCSKSGHFMTAVDFQEYIGIDVYQGEEYYVDNNIYLGKIDVKIPMALRGQESVTVRYTYDINGILIVDVVVDSTGEQTQQVMVNGSNTMSEEEIRGYLEELEKLKLHPANQEENQMVLSWGERLYAQTTGNLRNEIGNRLNDFQYLLQNETEQYKLKKYRKMLNKFFKNVDKYLNQFEENWNLKKDDIDLWYQDSEEDEESQGEYIAWKDGHLTS